MLPEVSIIITTYNYGQFIKQTLDSILKQTFKDYEIIVVDDGSTDRTPEIVEGCKEVFGGRLGYFYKENEGVAAARNYGIRKARGEFIAFIDADDLWSETSLEKLVSCIRQSPEVGLVYGNVEYFEVDLRKSLGRRFQPGLTPVPYEGKCFDKLFIHGNFIHTSASIVRRSVFETQGVFDKRFKCGEDLDMWIRVCAYYKIKYLDEVLTRVRKHTASLSFAFLASHKSLLLMTRKLLKSIPNFEKTIGHPQIKEKLYTAYYAIGIYSILEGENKRGRNWLLKAWGLQPTLVKNKLGLYLVLSFLPFSSIFKKFRKTPILVREKRPDRIKVLHIIKTLNIGGAENNLLNLAQCFNECFFEVHVAYSAQGELEPRFQKLGIKLFKFAHQPTKIKSLNSLVIIWRLIGYIRQERIKIVHTHTFNAHLWGGIAAKLTGCKIVEHVHDSRYIDPREFEKRGERNKQYKFIKFLRNFSDQVIVLTKQNQEFVINQRLYRPEMVQEIQNGVDLKAAKVLSPLEKMHLRQKLNLNRHAKIILSPIRFSPEKNLELLFRIALEVTDAFPDCLFVIAGIGPEKEKFESWVSAYGLQEKIKLIGFYADIPELLAISDVLLLPSTIELHSIAIMEAMRQKVAVVTSRNVGCNDKFITHWENGVLLDPFDKRGWSHAVLTLLENDSLRQRIGEAGFRTVVKDFDIKDVAKKFEHIYESLVAV